MQSFHSNHNTQMMAKKAHLQRTSGAFVSQAQHKTFAYNICICLMQKEEWPSILPSPQRVNSIKHLPPYTEGTNETILLYSQA